MVRIRTLDQAAHIALSATQSPPFVCRTCLSQATRGFHTTGRQQWDFSSVKNLRDALFGSDKEKKRREEAEKDEAAAQKAREANANNTKDVSTAASTSGTTIRARVTDLNELNARSARKQKELVVSKSKFQAYEVLPSKSEQEVGSDGYVPAETAEGLERIGDEEWIKHQRDTGVHYKGYNRVNNHRMKSFGPVEWENLVVSATIEALALQHANRALEDIMLPRRFNDFTQAMRTYPSSLFEAPVDRNGSFLERVSACIPKGTDAAVIPSSASRKYKIPSVQGGESRAWKLYVPEPHVRFMVMKRIQKLTGRKLPDPSISNKSLGELVEALAQNPAEGVRRWQQEVSVLNQLSNVEVFKTRRTPQLISLNTGRRRLILEELSLRGLLSAKEQEELKSLSVSPKTEQEELTLPASLPAGANLQEASAN